CRPADCVSWEHPRLKWKPAALRSTPAVWRTRSSPTWKPRERRARKRRWLSRWHAIGAHRRPKRRLLPHHHLLLGRSAVVDQAAGAAGDRADGRTLAAAGEGSNGGTRAGAPGHDSGRMALGPPLLHHPR